MVGKLDYVILGHVTDGRCNGPSVIDFTGARYLPNSVWVNLRPFISKDNSRTQSNGSMSIE